MTSRGTRRRAGIEALVRLTELADLVVPFAIRAAAALRVADHLAAGARSAEDLAQATGADVGALRRVLRALAVRGIFTERQPDHFALTPLAEPLRSDHPLSLRDVYVPLPADVEAWACADHSVRTGEPAFGLVHGMGLWEFLAHHPRDAERFDRGMAALTRLELRALLPAYDWTAAGARPIVDVGGGNGALLAGLLRPHRGLRGIVFDLPNVIERAGPVLAAAGLADRVVTVPGSFFETVPAGGGIYILKRILYGWDDERARTILARVRTAMDPNSRLVVVEPLAGVAGDPLGPVLDVLMLTVDGGRARSEEELAALMATAGLRLTRVATTMMLPVVEGLPVS